MYYYTIFITYLYYLYLFILLADNDEGNNDQLPIISNKSIPANDYNKKQSTIIASKPGNI